ncbi:MAG: YdcF family protein [Candidatus Omnitrophota bacterium]|nr:MAG: YdcF family protein [Candidatus Omnitrophota bacterium]
MLKNENIICISSIDWDFNWQGHQEIMSTFARNNNRVLFIENTGVRVPTLKDLPRLKKRLSNWLKGISGIRKEEENLFVFSPLVIPFPYSRIARWINRYLLLSTLKKWIKVMDFNDPIIWTFLPTGISLDLIANIDKKMSVYYCIAEFTKLVRDSRKIRRTEKELLKKADLIFAQGEKLKQWCESYNSNVTIFPFGVNSEAFHNTTLDGKESLPDLKGIKRPIIGYIGGLHKHIDYELIECLAARNPHWSFLFVGPVQTDVARIGRLDNVFLVGEKKHFDLPKYIGAFDVCLIPYLLTDYTSTVYPTKLNEYLIMGKPVLSTDLPEVRAFNQKYGNVLMIGQTTDEFKAYITEVLEKNDKDMVGKRIKAAQENSWKKRIEQMSNLIEEEIERKKHDKDLRWKEGLRKFYRQSRRSLKATAFACLLAYLLLFYTPFLWFAARPLKISEPLQAANAIVVFGGGVGEGGSPGKSTIERARYAGELYKSGYANHIIFSSGYSFKYNDAENMKLVALSAGVAEKDIILEQKANSTYENARFTGEIINDYGWSSILLVSSPYNMRRASLAFKKLNKNLKITYAPISNPQFYRRDGKVKWEQIRAIGHEYLGILYYFIKGYI